MALARAKSTIERAHNKRKCDRAIGFVDDLVVRKVDVSEQRMRQLQDLQVAIYSAPAGRAQPMDIAAINFAPHVQQQCVNSLQECCAVAFEDVGADEWAKVIQLVGPKSKSSAGLLFVDGTELTAIERSLVAVSLISSRPLLAVALPGSDAHQELLRLTGGTWPVFSSVGQLLQYIRDELPRVLRLCAAVEDDVRATVQSYREVNKLKHGLKRGAVALVPFAVHAVNLAGMMRLVRNMMADTGMVLDKQTGKGVAKLSAPVAGKVAAIECLGDVYQYGVMAMFAADLALGAAADAVLATSVLLDGLLLGSICVVTGTISAIGAALTRPAMVHSVARFLATLQTLYLLSPTMRRQCSGDGDEVSSGDDEQGPEPLTALRGSACRPAEATPGHLYAPLADMHADDDVHMHTMEHQPLLLKCA